MKTFTSESLIALEGISLHRGKNFFLQADRLELYPGRLYLLTGSNGAGKSTLLHLLALLHPPAKGELRFQGMPVAWSGSRLRQLRQEVTLLEQNPYLFSGTVGSNIALGLKMRGFSPALQQERIHDVLQAVGLKGFEERLASQLSGGETRRVALARALALRPRLLLLDEPTANLDLNQVAAFERLISTLPAQGICVVMASHDPDQPERLGGERIRLEDGRVHGPVSGSIAGAPAASRYTPKLSLLRCLKSEGPCHAMKQGPGESWPNRI